MPAGPFTTIQTTNWKHGQSNNNASLFREMGLIIAFDTKSVNPADLVPPSRIAQVMIVQRMDPHTVMNSAGQPIMTLFCWCDVQGQIQAGNLATLGDATSAFTTAGGPGSVSGVRFKSNDLIPGEYRVVFKGNFVRGLGKRAVDADHLPPWVGPFGGPYRTGDGVEGGLFESWFSLTQ